MRITLPSCSPHPLLAGITCNPSADQNRHRGKPSSDSLEPPATAAYNAMNNVPHATFDRTSFVHQPHFRRRHHLHVSILSDHLNSLFALGFAHLIFHFYAFIFSMLIYVY
ncbi:unnamed protein product [Lathyrus oleraceus]